MVYVVSALLVHSKFTLLTFEYPVIVNPAGGAGGADVAEANVLVKLTVKVLTCTSVGDPLFAIEVLVNVVVERNVPLEYTSYCTDDGKYVFVGAVQVTDNRVPSEVPPIVRAVGGGGGMYTSAGELHVFVPPDAPTENTYNPGDILHVVYPVFWITYATESALELNFVAVIAG
jgi:hypothetical protein